MWKAHFEVLIKTILNNLKSHSGGNIIHSVKNLLYIFEYAYIRSTVRGTVEKFNG